MSSTQLMTPELLEKALPRNLHGHASQEMADLVNQVSQDPEVAREVRENFLTYTKVLSDGKYKTVDYLNAVSYVTHKLMGYSNQDAYIRTFPGRYTRLRSQGATDKDISAYVAAYAKNQLVNKIMEQTVIPTWLLHQDTYAKAIGVQLELMVSANSEKVRSDAANSILTHLKPPDVAKTQIDVKVTQEDGIGSLRATLAELAQAQLGQIRAGVPTRDVAHQKLVIEHVPEPTDV